MNNKTIAEIVELIERLKKLGCSIEYDNDDQIIIYTGLANSENGIVEL